MPVLEGTNVDPRRVNDVIDRAELMKEGKRKEAKALAEDLSKWQAFHSSRIGQVVSDLADPMIEYLRNEICARTVVLREKLNSRGLINMTGDEIDIYKAECRGALEVWQTIKFRSDILERRLAEIQQSEGSLEPKEKRATEKKGEPLAKEVEKYT